MWRYPQALAATHDVASTQQAFVGLAVGWDGLQAGIFLKTKYAVLWYDAVWYAEKYGEQMNTLRRALCAQFGLKHGGNHGSSSLLRDK